MALNQCYSIKAAVGAQPRAVNNRADVEIIQKLLNEHAAKLGYAQLTVNGMVTPPMVQAIMTFQRSVVGIKIPDGRVDPGGNTLLKLNQPVNAPILARGSFSPAGKNFRERVDAFLKEAKAVYGVTITGKIERKPEDAQKWHVAHMICYNSFSGLKPGHSQTINGHNLIDWSYLANAGTAWEHLNWNDFLRDENGRVPVKQGNSWESGKAPVEKKTRQRAFEILESAGVATDKSRPNDLHSAQVAPGYQGCAEPCKCGGKASKHILGLAVDLGEAQLQHLQQKLQQMGHGSLDDYMKRFGLHRPLLPKETWHVEATNP